MEEDAGPRMQDPRTAALEAALADALAQRDALARL